MSRGQKDLYAVLGVARDASADTIKKAYRKIARDNHPDVNPGDQAAEERFKAASQAYDVLSEPEKRKNYDEFGEAALNASFDAKAARNAFGRGFGGPGGAGPGGGMPFGDMGDLFGDLFGGGGGRRGGPGMHRARKGQDLESIIHLSFEEAAKGGERQISVTRPTATGGTRTDVVLVRIPPGVDEGGKIRVRGKGGEGMGGGPPGDLFARVQVGSHPLFTRKGRDLHIDLPLTVREATLGAKVEVPTLEGGLTLTIPPETDGGKRLRLKGKGIASPKKGGSPGDLYVMIQIVVPKGLDDAAKGKLEELSAFDLKDIRAKLGES